MVLKARSSSSALLISIPRSYPLPMFHFICFVLRKVGQPTTNGYFTVKQPFTDICHHLQLSGWFLLLNCAYWQYVTLHHNVNVTNRWVRSHFIFIYETTSVSLLDSLVVLDWNTNSNSKIKFFAQLAIAASSLCHTRQVTRPTAPQPCAIYF